MGQTAIVSPQIIDSTSIGRDLITAADQAAAQAIIGVTGVDTGADYTWTGDHVFDGSIEATAYNFTAGVDGQLNHPDLASSLYVRFNNSNVYRFNALDFWPVANGTKNLGRSDHRWANVYSVDGDFSGTLTTPNVTGTSNLYLQNGNDTASISVAGSGGVTIRANNAIAQQFTPTGVNYRVDCLPTFDGSTNLGLDTNRWGTTYSVDGSFSGNLVSETGGTTRLYGLGTEGDTDTHFLETNFSSFYNITTKTTGAASNKAIMLQYAEQNRLLISSSEVRIYKYLRPSDTTIDIGSTANPFRTVYSVDGDFSGTVTVDQIHRGYLATNTLYITHANR